MDTTTIAALIGIAGMVVSALLGSFGYFFKVRAERKKGLKHVLYYLLEIRHSVVSNNLDPDQIQKSFFNYCTDWFKENLKTDDIAIPDNARKFIVAYIVQMVAANASQIDGQLIGQFNNALLELSKENPVLAYKIKGRERLGEINKVLSDYTAKLQSLPEVHADTILKKVFPEQVNNAHSQRLNELLNDLDQDIGAVSRQCGFLTHQKCRRIMKQKIERNIDFSKLGIDKELRTVFEALVAQQNQ